MFLQSQIKAGRVFFLGKTHFFLVKMAMRGDRSDALGGRPSDPFSPLYARFLTTRHFPLINHDVADEGTHLAILTSKNRISQVSKKSPERPFYICPR